MKKIIILLAIAIFGITNFIKKPNWNQVEKSLDVSLTPTVSELPKTPLKIIKDVGEAYMDKFGLSEKDFEMISKEGFDVIEGNFDICSNDDDVMYLLNQSQKYGLKVILNAGSGEAEWGYACDSEYPKSQKPVWQRDKVISWINKWKSYPSLFGWDTSNEAGSVFPNSEETESMLTFQQLQQAYRDVKNTDPEHPVMIRMNGWFFYDNEKDFFGYGNPFGNGVADIVMVNAYSNVSDYYPDFVKTVMGRASTAIWNIDPKIKIVGSLGVWKEPPIWFEPSIEHLKNDYENLRNTQGIYAIAYFKYGAKNSEWYLPDNSPSLWGAIQELSGTQSQH
jgi:hypothetical protein